MLQREFSHRPEYPTGSIAHHDVQTIAILLELLEKLLHTARIGHVGLQCPGAAAMAPDFLADRFGEVMGIVVIHRDVASRFRQFTRDGAADATRGARYQRDFTRKRKSHYGSSITSKGLSRSIAARADQWLG